MSDGYFMCSLNAVVVSEEKQAKVKARRNQAFYPVYGDAELKSKGKRFVRSGLSLCLWIVVAMGLLFAINGDLSFTVSDGAYHFFILCMGGFTILVALVIHTVLHELGHVLGGLAGCRILITFIVGRWRYEKTVKGYHWRKGKPIAGISGAAAMVLDTSKAGKNADGYQLLFMAGGVVMNLLCGSIALYVCWYHTAHWGIFFVALGLFGITGIGVGLLNLVPFSTKGWNSDGQQMLRLLRHREDDLTQRLFYLSSLYFCGHLIKDWPQELLPTRQELESPDLAFDKKISGYNMLLNYALAIKDHDLSALCACWIAQQVGRMPDGVLQQNAHLMLKFALVQEDMALFEAWRPYANDGLLNGEAALHYMDAMHAFEMQDYAQAHLFVHKAAEKLDEVITMLDYNELKAKVGDLENRLQSTLAKG